MKPGDEGAPNAGQKFARWLAEHPIRLVAAVSPRRPEWIERPRPRLKALIEPARPV